MRNLVIASLVLTAAAGVFGALAISAQQPDRVPLAFIPLLFALVAAVLSGAKAGRLVVVLAALALTAFVILGLASIGWFYAPGALAMLAASLWPQGGERRNA